jgi:hypothetical protein
MYRAAFAANLGLPTTTANQLLQRREYFSVAKAQWRKYHNASLRPSQECQVVMTTDFEVG